MKDQIKVLLIEDNPGDARLIREYLSEVPGTFFRISTAETLAKGLELLDEGGVDVVLLDLTLPDSNKENTSQSLRVHSPYLPIVILSGFEDKEFALELVRMGAQDYLVKGELNSELLSRVILYAIERKRAEESMKQDKEKLSKITSAINDAVILVDQNGNISYWNPSAERIFGYSVNEVTGKHLHSLITPERYLDAAEKGFAKFRKSGEGAVIGKITEIFGLRKNGEEFPLALSISSMELHGQYHAVGVIRDITERKKAEQALQKSEQRLSMIYDSVGDVLYYLAVEPDDCFRFLSVNQAFLDATGLAESRIVGKRIEDVIPEPSVLMVRDNYKKAIDENRVVRWEETSEYPAGVKVGEVSIAPIVDDNGVCTHLVGSVHDITKRRQAETRIKSLSRTLEATSACNKALIRAKDESELLAEICKIVAETGGYKMAWVGEAVEENGERLVKPLECNCSSIECDYLSGIRITWSDDKFGRGPAGTAIRTGKPAVMRSIENDPLYAPWRDKALQHGFRSSLTLPLVVSGKMFGVLNIYSGREDAFDRKEWELLEEMAGDLAFGITTLRMLEEKKRHGRLIELLLNSTSEGVYGVDTKGNCTFVNASCLKILGYDDESELLGENMYGLLHHARQDGTPYSLEECPLHHACSKGKKAHVDDEFFWRRDRTSFPVSYRAVPVFSEDELTGAVVTFLDITEQIRAREALLESHERLKASLEGTIKAVTKAVEARDPYTAGHQQRVARIACKIACEMGLDENIVEGIRMGATIHDIGKIHLPAEILSKPAKLTATEFSLVKSHPEVGHDILADVPFPWPVADIAWQHHEHLDGSGYPQGLKGDEMCIEARIVAVADVVEAMASHRPYRPALGIAKALEEVKAHRDDWYDPDAVDACIRLFTEKGFSLDTPT